MSIPREFRYWENLGRPWARVVRRAWRAALGYDPAPDPALIEAFAASYFDADPVAERFVDEVMLPRGTKTGRALLDQAVEHGLEAVADPPAALVALLSDIDDEPAWLDRAVVERGAKAFRRYGTSVFRFAGAVTLAAYAECSVAKPLILTGAYAEGTAKHRFLETASFWIDVSEPGGLDAGAAGRRAAIRVRVMHVFVRRKLERHPEWRREDWGVPISQGDAVLTLLGGSFAPGFALRAMGYWADDDDILAMMHFWRYVGHLMGVRPSFFPRDLREAGQLSFAALIKASHGAGDDGRRLCAAFYRAFEPTGKERGLARYRALVQSGIHRGYTRLFMPPWSYRWAQLPPAGAWALWPLAQFPKHACEDLLRRRSARFDRWLDARVRADRRLWLSQELGGKRVGFLPVERFTR